VPKLVIFRGDAVENEIRLSGNTLRVGRHNRNEVVLDDAANGVSRFHAEIRPEGSGYVIVDLNSRNGVWINGRRIKEKAALSLGVPATVGGFELTLEDDVSTGEFAAVPANNAPTIAAGSAARKSAPDRASGSSAARPPLFANKRQTLIWGGTGAALLLITVLTFAVVRYKTRPPLPPEPQTATATTSIPAEPEPPKKTEEEIKKEENARQVAQHLDEARVQIEEKEYSSALRDHLQPALELDPENTQALEMKHTAEEAIAEEEKKGKRGQKPSSPPPPASDPDTPGIPHRQGESPADYATRVRRVQVAYSEGNASASKNEYDQALRHFRAVDRDQPHYQNVDSLISETLARQQKAVEEAVTSGQQNETAGKLRDARLWYQKALEIDPGSTAARDKANQARARATKAAEDLFTKASAAEKLGARNSAIQYYQQIIDTMLPSDEISDRAKRKLEALK